MSNSSLLDTIDMEEIKEVALKAGNAIMEIYTQKIEVAYKEDASPLTKADQAANEIICHALQAHFPNIPLLSEENKEVPYEIRKHWEYYWCIDPLDGTKEFIKKNGEFTVNIALIHKDTPVLGVVYAPALGEMYWAKKGEGAYKNGEKLPLHVNTSPKEKLCVVASKSHLSKETQAFIDALETKCIEQVFKGSSLKLCMVAEGIADIYPRLSPTMEWDIAAADILVREAGMMTYEFPSLKQLQYNRKNLLNPYFITRKIL